MGSNVEWYAINLALRRYPTWQYFDKFTFVIKTWNKKKREN